MLGIKVTVTITVTDDLLKYQSVIPSIQTVMQYLFKAQSGPQRGMDDTTLATAKILCSKLYLGFSRVWGGSEQVGIAKDEGWALVSLRVHMYLLDAAVCRPDTAQEVADAAAAP